MREVNSLVLDFCKQNRDNWEELLSNSPYCLKIKKSENFIIFNYDMILSDLSLPICQEARGIIIDDGFTRVCCRSFNKFFNYGETNAAKIDWESAVVQEKIDGSLIRIWWDNSINNEGWIVSTSGTIYAFDAKLNDSNKSFYELFMEAVKGIDGRAFIHLDRKYTYVFELVSPENRIVVRYPETKIYHTGTFDNETGKESFDSVFVYDNDNRDFLIPNPKQFSIKSIDDCISFTKEMTIDQEGFVVVDKYRNRIKIKSPAYLAAHRIRGNGILTYERIIDMIKAKADDDLVGIYPEYTHKVEEVRMKIKEYTNVILKYVSVLDHCLDRNRNRKNFAEHISSVLPEYKQVLFIWYDGKFELDNCLDWCYNYLMSKQNNKILEMIGVK